MKYIVFFFERGKAVDDSNLCHQPVENFKKGVKRGPPRLFTRLDGSYLANTHIIAKLRLQNPYEKDSL